MRLQGYANKSMQGMVLGALLNCILDPLLSAHLIWVYLEQP